MIVGTEHGPRSAPKLFVAAMGDGPLQQCLGEFQPDAAAWGCYRVTAVDGAGR